jgi:hypothetical protein
VLGEGLAGGFAEAGDDAEDAIGNAGLLGEGGELERREWRLLAALYCAVRPTTSPEITVSQRTDVCVAGGEGGKGLHPERKSEAGRARATAKPYANMMQDMFQGMTPAVTPKGSLSVILI